MVESDIDSVFSFVDSSTASTYTAGEIYGLQSEILKQSKQIERFLEGDDCQEDESALVVLKSLFALFKSELSVNLSLRKVLMEETRRSALLTEEIDVMTEEVRNLGYEGIAQVSDVTIVLKKQLKVKHRIKRLKREAAENAHTISDMKATISNLELQNTEILTQLSARNNRISDQEQEIRDLISSLNQKEEEVKTVNSEKQALEVTFSKELESFRSRIKEFEEEKRKLEAKLSHIKTKSDKEKKEANEASVKQIDELESLRSRIKEFEEEKRKFETKLSHVKTKSEKRKKEADEATVKQTDELESLRSRMKEFEEEKRKFETRLSRIKTKSEKEKKEVSEANVKQIDELNAVHRQEISELKLHYKSKHQGSLEEFKREFQFHLSELKDKELLIEQQKQQINELQSLIDRHESDRDGQNDHEVEKEEKYQRLLHRIHSLKKEVDRIAEVHLYEIGETKKECEQQQHKLRRRLRDAFASEIAKADLTEKELRLQISEQEIENKRLRDQLRQYSYLLGQKDEELARFQIEGSADVLNRSEGCFKRKRKTTGLYLTPDDG
jgi:chromosome segregation ATPase